MGYWQWVSVGLFVVPILLLLLVESIVRVLIRKFTKPNEIGVKMVDGITPGKVA